MRPLFLGATLVTLSLIASCSHFSESRPAAPTAELALQSGVSLAELGEGHSIFMRQCSQCHEQRIPKAIPTEQWHLIVPGMAWNAGLSKEEEKRVTQYVIAASKK